MSTFGGGYKVASKLDLNGVASLTYTVPAEHFAIFTLLSFSAGSAPTLSIDGTVMNVTPGSTLTNGNATSAMWPGGIFAGPGAVVTVSVSVNGVSMSGVLFTNG